MYCNMFHPTHPIKHAKGCWNPCVREEKWVSEECSADFVQRFKFRWFLGPSDQNPKSAIHTPLLSKILDFSDRKNLWYPFKCNMLFFRNSLWTWGRCHAKCWICGYVGMVMWISVNGNVPDLDHLISTVMDRDLIKTMKRIFGLVLKLVTVLMLTQLTMQNQIGRRLNPQPMQAGQQDLGP